MTNIEAIVAGQKQALDETAKSMGLPTISEMVGKSESVLLSNCCGAEVGGDSDICTECKEHCGAVDANDRDYSFEINKWVLA